jgi:hypothetical protein
LPPRLTITTIVITTIARPSFAAPDSDQGARRA